MEETKALRVFYNKLTGLIVWYHELRGLEGALTTSKDFPTLILADLNEIPHKRPHPIILPDESVIDGDPLGGTPEDYECYETENPDEIATFFSFHGEAVNINQVRKP